MTENISEEEAKHMVELLEQEEIKAYGKKIE